MALPLKKTNYFSLEVGHIKKLKLSGVFPPKFKILLLSPLRNVLIDTSKVVLDEYKPFSLF